MIKNVFTVDINPESAAKLLKNSSFAGFLYEETIKIDESKKVIVLVFEKYMFRVEGKAGVTVIVENTSGETRVKVITAGVGQGILFDFDWGASDSLIKGVRNCLAGSIIRESEL